MNWITVREFCEQEGISHQCVYQKLKYARYGKLREHIKESYGKPMLLDEEAVEYLRPRSPSGNLQKDALAGIEKRLAAVEEALAVKCAETQDLTKRIERLEHTIAMSIFSQQNIFSRSANDRQKRET